MKKYLWLFAAIIVAFSLVFVVSCGGSGNKSGDDDNGGGGNGGGGNGGGGGGDDPKFQEPVLINFDMDNADDRSDKSSWQKTYPYETPKLQDNPEMVAKIWALSNESILRIVFTEEFTEDNCKGGSTGEDIIKHVGSITWYNPASSWDAVTLDINVDEYALPTDTIEITMAEFKGALGAALPPAHDDFYEKGSLDHLEFSLFRVTTGQDDIKFKAVYIVEWK